ncbi:sensor histidine kinase [Gelidibacter maritimus]|uniref:histidine kinase n=1 Tax=Gelidibacter maritimus TaxID=2761487 RepID=A0A7W2M624_9FLAO|nr:HAMP domain-containing sensor histidine kinase [Gelidibacter maritimus]MBA6153369.1 PAS domain S-box protein [Gelidibacter maritimus]
MPRHLVDIKDKLFENIFENAPNGIAIVGLDYRWVKVNQSMTELLGYSEEEFYAMKFPDITHKDDLESDIIQLRKLERREIDSYQIEMRYFHKNGSVIWCLLSVSMQFHADGRPLYFISQVVDITKQKEILWEINSIKEIAKNQSDKLMNFAHIATHDIRSHIGNLGMITDFMEEETAGIKDDENFKMLKESLSQLEITISNLNEVRRDDFSQHGNLSPKKLRAFVENAIYNMNAIAKNEDCKIINEVNHDVHVMGVSVYLDSIILNFLTNAIKYSSKERSPYVRLRSFVEDDFVILEIEDNGLGIDLETHQNDLFQFRKTFHKFSDSRGVGLFITKNHVERMGGKIEVKSTVGVGTTFRVYFQKAELAS